MTPQETTEEIRQYVNAEMLAHMDTLMAGITTKAAKRFGVQMTYTYTYNFELQVQIPVTA